MDDIDVRLYQLAVRGAAELPNDPFAAFESVELKNEPKVHPALRAPISVIDLATAARMAAPDE